MKTRSPPGRFCPAFHFDCLRALSVPLVGGAHRLPQLRPRAFEEAFHPIAFADRKSTRLNSSHLGISYAVFCLKKKTKPQTHTTWRPPHPMRCLLCRSFPSP